jgi:hypothetical protein
MSSLLRAWRQPLLIGPACAESESSIKELRTHRILEFLQAPSTGKAATYGDCPVGAGASGDALTRLTHLPHARVYVGRTVPVWRAAAPAEPWCSGWGTDRRRLNSSSSLPCSASNRVATGRLHPCSREVSVFKGASLRNRCASAGSGQRRSRLARRPQSCRRDRERSKARR